MIADRYSNEYIVYPTVHIRLIFYGQNTVNCFHLYLNQFGRFKRHVKVMLIKRMSFLSLHFINLTAHTRERISHPAKSDHEKYTSIRLTYIIHYVACYYKNGPASSSESHNCSSQLQSEFLFVFQAYSLIHCMQIVVMMILLEFWANTLFFGLVQMIQKTKYKCKSP